MNQSATFYEKLSEATNGRVDEQTASEIFYDLDTGENTVLESVQPQLVELSRSIYREVTQPPAQENEPEEEIEEEEGTPESEQAEDEPEEPNQEIEHVRLSPIIQSASNALEAISEIIRNPINEYFEIVNGEVTAKEGVTQEQAILSIQHVIGTQAAANVIADTSGWALGGIISEGRRLFPEMDLSEIAGNDKKAYGTLITALGVYEAFPPGQRFGLSFTHHKEVYYARIENSEKARILQLAEDHNLTTKDVREIASTVRKEGGDVLQELSEAGNKEQIKESLKEYKAETVYAIGITQATGAIQAIPLESKDDANDAARSGDYIKVIRMTNPPKEINRNGEIVALFD